MEVMLKVKTFTKGYSLYVCSNLSWILIRGEYKQINRQTVLDFFVFFFLTARKRYLYTCLDKHHYILIKTKSVSWTKDKIKYT